MRILKVLSGRIRYFWLAPIFVPTLKENMLQLEGRINNEIAGVKRLTVRDDHAAEARGEYVTKPHNVLYIVIALVNIKTSCYLSKTNEV